MQTRHRTRHRWMWLILSIATGLALFLALTSDHRREVGVLSSGTKEIPGEATEPEGDANP